MVTLLFFQIFIGGGEHQLDTVELIYLTCSRVVVDCYDICLWVTSAQFFDNTFTDNVVWQTAKRLCTDDICCTAVDQFHHFTCQEPSFPGLVTNGYDLFCVIYKIIDIGRRIKVFGLLKCLGSGRADKVYG